MQFLWLYCYLTGFVELENLLLSSVITVNFGLGIVVLNVQIENKNVKIRVFYTQIKIKHVRIR